MDNLRGAILMVLAMALFAVEDMFIKLVSDTLSVGQILTMLGLGGSVAFGSVVIAQRGALFSRAMFTPAIIVRAAGEVIGTLGFVSAISLTPLSSASAILQATPLVVTLGAALFLGEQVGWRRWAAVLIGLSGVLLIIRPGLDSFEPLSVLALLGVLGLAMRDLGTRRVPAGISSMQLSFLGFLVIIPAGIGLMLATGTAWTGPGPRGWGLMAAALGIGLFAYYAIVVAMRMGEVSFVTPFRYSRLIFAMVIGVAVFGERPDTLTLCGAAIIVGSGIYTVWRERKRRVIPAASLSKTGPSV